MDLGLMIEGRLELVDGRWIIIDGNLKLDVLEALEKHKGKEVRLICTPLQTIAELARMVEVGEVEI
jgi:hypothetical protein